MKRVVAPRVAGDPNRSALIRPLLAQGMKPADIVTTLGERGVEVKLNLIDAVRKQDRKKAARPVKYSNRKILNMLAAGEITVGQSWAAFGNGGIIPPPPPPSLFKLLSNHLREWRKCLDVCDVEPEPDVPFIVVRHGINMKRETRPLELIEPKQLVARSWNDWPEPTQAERKRWWAAHKGDDRWVHLKRLFDSDKQFRAKFLKRFWAWHKHQRVSDADFDNHFRAMYLKIGTEIQSNYKSPSDDDMDDQIRAMLIAGGIDVQPNP